MGVFDYYDDNYREYKRMVRAFKNDYPELWVRGTSFKPSGYMEIEVIIPRKGVLYYTPIGTKQSKIHWKIGPLVDPEEVKRKERDMRPDMYQNFLREIDIYQKCTGASQGDIARMTGLSRQSINKYLSGGTAPKVSTMKKIAETLGIDM